MHVRIVKRIASITDSLSQAAIKHGWRDLALSLETSSILARKKLEDIECIEKNGYIDEVSSKAIAERMAKRLMYADIRARRQSVAKGMAQPAPAELSTSKTRPESTPRNEPVLARQR